MPDTATATHAALNSTDAFGTEWAYVEATIDQELARARQCRAKARYSWASATELGMLDGLGIDYDVRDVGDHDRYKIVIDVPVAAAWSAGIIECLRRSIPATGDGGLALRGHILAAAA